MQDLIRKWSPAQFTRFSSHRGTVLSVGSGKQYSTITDALEYIATQTWASGQELSGTITTETGSASATGSGFSSLEENNYLLVGAKYEPVKSIESDSAITLWSGAQDTVADSAAMIYELKQFTLELYDDQTITNVNLPNGVDVLIVGHTPNIVLTETGDPIGLAYYCKLEITHITINLTSSGEAGVFFGGHSLGRGIIHIHDLEVSSNNTGSSLSAGAFGSSIIVERVHGHCIRFNVGGDYIYLDGFNVNTSSTSDHFLFANTLGTDYGHPVTIKNHVSISTGQVIAGQSAGFEFNVFPPSKVFNLDNVVALAYHTTTPIDNFAAQALWTPSSGTVNISNSIIDCINNTTDVLSRGATVNIVSSTRSDGSAIRQVVA